MAGSADFTPLPVVHGAGPWHFNRFRIVFELGGRSVTDLANNFRDNFSRHFDNPLTGAVDVDGRKFGGQDVMRFRGFKIWMLWEGIPVNLNFCHTDWVYKLEDVNGRGFAAQTLKRNFAYGPDQIPTQVLMTKNGAKMISAANLFFRPIGFELGAVRNATQLFNYVNSLHFLAGRRSWVVGNTSELAAETNGAIPGGLGYLETAAIERFSSVAYWAADKAMDFEGMVPKIWGTLLEQFVSNNRLDVFVPHVKANPLWTLSNGKLWYYQAQGSVLGDIRPDEVHHALRLHPHISPQ